MKTTMCITTTSSTGAIVVGCASARRLREDRRWKNNRHVVALLLVGGSVLLCSAKAASFQSLPHGVSQQQLKNRRITRSCYHRLWAGATTATATTSSSDAIDSRTSRKQKLLELLRTTNEPVIDPVLADPITKEPLLVQAYTSSGLVWGDDVVVRRNRRIINYRLYSNSSTATYAGKSNTYLNLLEPTSSTSDSTDSTESSSSSNLNTQFTQGILPFIPPPIRSALATAGFPVGSKYVPMRDLFTSPAVSYAYERGWRQGFAAAGFPGPDIEAKMAMDYFLPATIGDSAVIVDMSCATGLFTRRFAASGQYQRVLGCDYSASMLDEARRRIDSISRRRLVGPRSRSTTMSTNPPQKRFDTTVLDLIRLDVGQIPMQNNSIDALHAGAAMHCWPDLPAAVSEIYRVLKPNGGRYFATTFLSSYFGVLQRSEGGTTGPSRQAFQYFESLDQLKSLLVSGGFSPDQIFIELLGNACVVIRCEK